ncbi:hypothetical protein AG1IA_09044 [Rhizoctonia solani AG-1 IA]|uniref:Uncharacterized protein n=1 Tax=Thanatephorus cucumeris (strain AG1-IA) TaxID=983506 RepID=L8WFH8_THACA|nr:hypothetical protein AG1IA_09044 [Rhizoctonia solani AG-1 IA]
MPRNPYPTGGRYARSRCGCESPVPGGVRILVFFWGRTLAGVGSPLEGRISVVLRGRISAQGSDFA